LRFRGLDKFPIADDPVEGLITLVNYDIGGIHGWGFTFGTKDLRTMLQVDLCVYHDLLLFDQ
jgi:hypothetical protein